MDFQTSESLAERIAQHVSQQIISGQLEANTRIQEARIVAELGVSRGPVREALLILERRHMVEIRPRKGAVVTSLTSDQISALFNFFGHQLEMLTCLVAKHWQEQELDPLVEQVALILTLAAEADRNVYMSAVFELMRKAYPIVNNPYLEEVLESLQPAIHRAYALAQNYVSNDEAAAIVFFDGLLNAVLVRDTTPLAGLIKTYMDYQADLVFKALAAS